MNARLGSGLTSDAEAAVVAFYGVRLDEEVLREVYEVAVEWLHSVGVAATHMSVRGTGFTGKVGVAERVLRRVKEVGFSPVESFSLFSLGPSGRIPVSDSLASFECSSGGSYVVAGASSCLTSLDAVAGGAIAKKLASVAKPAYGIGYCRERRLGPEFYAIGVCQGLGMSGNEYLEGVQISRWGDSGMKLHVYSNGLLRDVYPYNYLNDAHLGRRIDGMPLQEWIQKDEARGRLEPIAGLYVWTLGEDMVPAVRRALGPAGVIWDGR